MHFTHAFVHHSTANTLLSHRFKCCHQRRRFLLYLFWNWQLTGNRVCRIMESILSGENNFPPFIKLQNPVRNSAPSLTNALWRLCIIKFSFYIFALIYVFWYVNSQSVGRLFSGGENLFSSIFSKHTHNDFVVILFEEKFVFWKRVFFVLYFDFVIGILTRHFSVRFSMDKKVFWNES